MTAANDPHGIADPGGPRSIADPNDPRGTADGARAPLTILWFAWLRERTGTAEEHVSPPPDIATVGGLIDWLSARSPRYAAAFQNRRAVRCAVNQDFADPATPVRPGDEVAFFPPVTGG
jgi:molybdopterin synthase sulfur carrier subunit